MLVAVSDVTRLTVSPASVLTRYSSGFGAAMYLNPPRADRPQRAPSEVEQWRERLGVELARRQIPTGQRRRQVDAVRIEAGHTELPEQRRREIDEADVGLDHGGAQLWAGHDQRHPQRRVVDEHAVADLAVLAERLPMVGRDGDDGRAGVAAERLDQSHDLAIRFGDLVVVARRDRPAIGASPYGACGSNRWTHRKKRCARWCVQPCDRLVCDDAAWPFAGGTALRSARHAIAIASESL